MTSTAITLTPAEEKAADKARLLTVLVNVCGMPHAGYKTHPMVLALKRDGIVCFNMDFIRHEMKLHALSTKSERLLWHQ